MFVEKQLIIEPCDFEVGLATLGGGDAHSICHKGYALRV